MAQVTLENLQQKLKSGEVLDRPEQLAFMQLMTQQFKGHKLSGMTTYGKIFAGSVQLDGFQYGRVVTSPCLMHTSALILPTKLSVSGLKIGNTLRCCI